MRFLSMYKSVERNATPSQEEMAAMGKLVEEGMKAGWLLATEGCLPSALNSKEEAIELAKDFLGHVGDGECELRQLYEAPAR
jgi:hypothetical protein